MSRKKDFLAAEFADRFKVSYGAVPQRLQKSIDKVVLAIIKRDTTPGKRVKPIQPDKYYYEARVSSGDRLIFRVEECKVLFIDVVEHDDIARYGKKFG